MKEKFLELIEKLKTLGIAAKFCSAYNASQLSEEWEKFLNENPELVEEIRAWGQEFAANSSEPIFTESVDTEDSKEIVIIIRVCNDGVSVSECEIFEDYHVLEDALRATEETVAIAVAGISSDDNLGIKKIISEITAEEIFEYIEDNLTDEDSDAEESSGEKQEEEPDESDDDGEAESGGANEEIEPGDDGYDDGIETGLGDHFDDDFDLIPGRE